MDSQRSEHFAVTNRNWPGALMFGLLYPAVLGTFFYSLLPETLQAVRDPSQVSHLQLAKLCIAFLLIFHFLIDYYLTQQVALETNHYPKEIFFLDLMIVLSLFVAYDSVHLDDRDVEPEIGWVAGAMIASYVAFRVWEHKMRPVIGRSASLIVFETIMAVVFLVVALWRNLWALGGALIVSSLLMYIIGKPIVRRFHVRGAE